jgi:hypothetical protein
MLAHEESTRIRIRFIEVTLFWWFDKSTNGVCTFYYSRCARVVASSTSISVNRGPSSQPTYAYRYSHTVLCIVWQARTRDAWITTLYRKLVSSNTVTILAFTLSLSLSRGKRLLSGSGINDKIANTNERDTHQGASYHNAMIVMGAARY